MNIHCPWICHRQLLWLACQVWGCAPTVNWPNTSVRHHNTNNSAKAVLFASLLVPLTTLAQSAVPDCKCRAPGGQMRDLGSVECVDIVGSKSLMICVMSTNTPYWKKIDGSNGCPA